MSITRSYNKYTDTYYAYDTTYEWDEKAQKKVQRKRCIGKYDPETGEVIPTGKRGRPAKPGIKKEHTDIHSNATVGFGQLKAKAEVLYSSLDAIEAQITKTIGDVRELRESLDRLLQQIQDEN